MLISFSFRMPAPKAVLCLKNFAVVLFPIYVPDLLPKALSSSATSNLHSTMTASIMHFPQHPVQVVRLGIQLSGLCGFPGPFPFLMSRRSFAKYELTCFAHSKAEARPVFLGFTSPAKPADLRSSSGVIHAVIRNSKYNSMVVLKPLLHAPAGWQQNPWKMAFHQAAGSRRARGNPNLRSAFECGTDNPARGGLLNIEAVADMFNLG